MKISQAIAQLEAIRKKYGDIAITGGAMSDDMPLNSICVTDVDGVQIWPSDHRRAESRHAGPAIDGVFLQ